MYMDNKLAKAALAELIGTFTLVFVGVLSVMVTGNPINNANVLIPAFGHGLAVLGLIYVFGHISGTHINPAVTAGLLVGGKIKLIEALAYWIAQFLGGIIAAYLAVALVPDPTNYGQTIGIITADHVWTAAVFEAVLTFFLVSAVYQAAVYGKAGNLAGVAIGLTLTFSIIAGGVFTGASLNPARTLGPALAAGDLSYVLPYFVGIFAGGIAAGLLHAYVFKPED
jgi:MIP family channel proteins